MYKLLRCVPTPEYKKLQWTFTNKKNLMHTLAITPYTDQYFFDTFSHALPFGEDLIKNFIFKT